MNRIAFIAAVAVTTLAMSCGQNAQKKKSAVQTGESQTEVEHEIDDEPFGELIEKIYYSLPASVMPPYLETEKQRREADVVLKNSGNCVIETRHHVDGYDQWEIAIYMKEDKNNVIVIVRYGSGLDGFVLDSDKTLNYNITTGEFTEIELPMEPVTIDEMFDASLFDSPENAIKAKEYLIETELPLCYLNFNKDGFEIRVDIFYWERPEYFELENEVKSSRKWNGKRFEKGVRWHWVDKDWAPLNEN